MGNWERAWGSPDGVDHYEVSVSVVMQT
ncbi:hypothetical protein XHV734_4404 [Xanthomonas hortorum pv. vitians]|nr:hypothetical protein XHV734_4404 [Xanthomonas hortorum pv. vitians]